MKRFSTTASSKAKRKSIPNSCTSSPWYVSDIL